MKYGALTIDLITVAKVLPLLLIIAGGLFKIDAANLASGTLPAYGNLMRSLFLLAFAFGGFEVMTIPSGETINPRFHVPRALITGTFIVAAIYFMTSTHVAWGAVVILLVSSTIGGQVGARVGRRIPAEVLRAIIIVVGTGVAIKLLVD